MIIRNIIQDSFGLLSKQLEFYWWHFGRNLDDRQRQELIELLYAQHFEKLANKIRNLNKSAIKDCRQQIGKLLFEHCMTRNRRHQLIQLIESDLLDINVRLDNYGKTLLHRSAYNLDVELVRLLIERGVNIRLRDYAGNTALHIAIQSYRNRLTIYENGASVVENLTAIINLLLKADKDLQLERHNRKRIRLSVGNDNNYTPQNFAFNSNTASQILDNNNNEISNNQLIDNQLTLNSCNTASTKCIDCNSTSPSELESNQETRQFRCAHHLNNEHSQDDLKNTLINKSHIGINPILLEDPTSSLVDTKNAFGKTALHYCVLVVGEQHLEHFVKLLISFEADTDVIDARMRTPLYCLVKRPGISSLIRKCQSISHLLKSGCDDLGLTVDLDSLQDEELIKKLNIKDDSQRILKEKYEPIFSSTGFKRVPSLKHITRIRIIKFNNEQSKLNRQTNIELPNYVPKELNPYLNRKIIDHDEFF